MLTYTLTVFGCSLGLFVLWLLLVGAEQARGKRLFLAGVRGWMDKVTAAAGRAVHGALEHFVKYVVKLSWYYSVHSFLRAILRMLVAAYEYLESVFERNRAKTKKLRAEKKERIEARTHLTAMAEHKSETALTPAQQRKVKKDHLEGNV